MEEIRKKIVADIFALMPQYIEHLTWPQEKLKEEIFIRRELFFLHDHFFQGK
jgi:hypothetical protein